MPSRDKTKRHVRSLIELAQSGAPRPKQSEFLGRVLARLTAKTPTHDPAFSEQIRKLRPDWFALTWERQSGPNKAALLEIARSGGPRPSNKPHSVWLSRYTRPTKSYDPEFTKEIKALRPDWFDYKVAMKNKLLEVAKAGDPRPMTNSTLGKWLTKAKKDKAFLKRLYKLRPDWEHISLKDKLLEMAKQGAPRPAPSNSTHSIYQAFRRHTNQYGKDHSTYDPEFTNKLKNLRPDWFGPNLTRDPDHRAMLTQRRGERSQVKETTSTETAPSKWDTSTPHPARGSRYHRLRMAQKS